MFSAGRSAIPSTGRGSIGLARVPPGSNWGRSTSPRPSASSSTRCSSGRRRGRRPIIAAELARAAATPPAGVAAGIEHAYPDGVPLVGRVLVRGPRPRARAVGRGNANLLGHAAGAVVEPHGGGAGERDRLARTTVGGRGPRGGLRGPTPHRSLEGRRALRRAHGQDGRRGRPRRPRAAPRSGRVHLAARVAAHGPP